MIFNSSILDDFIFFKLWRCDDFVGLPKFRNGVFVPRYARNLFIDHWVLLGQKKYKCGFGKRNERQLFVLFFFSLHGFQRLRLFTLAASLARLPFKSALWLGQGPHILLDSLRILFGNLVFAMKTSVCQETQQTCYSVASRACVKKHNRHATT